MISASVISENNEGIWKEILFGDFLSGRKFSKKTEEEQDKINSSSEIYYTLKIKM